MNNESDQRDLRVFIVDDEAFICRLIHKVLLSSPRRYEVESCTDGEQAVQKISAFRPDIVLLDVNLPGKNGLEISRQVRQLFPRDAASRPLIVIMSGNIAGENAAHVHDAGADRFLPKPFTREELLEKIALQ